MRLEKRTIAGREGRGIDLVVKHTVGVMDLLVRYIPMVQWWPAKPVGVF